MSTQKRLLLAAALSLGVLLLCTKLFPEPQRPAATRPAPVPTAASSAGAPAASSSARPGEQKPDNKPEPGVEPVAAAEEALTTV